MRIMDLSFTWTVVVLTMSVVGSSQVIPSVEEYFEDRIAGDLSKVTWKHAVNNVQLLDEALKDNTVMMLEADILMGRKASKKKPDLIRPIMAHPPSTTSDLSFDDFLAKVSNAVKSGEKKGIKLDFKDIKAVAPVLQSLKKKKSINFPVWLNADILQGPVNATKTPINATEFLRNCSEIFPEGTLSVGWVTRYGWDDSKAINRSLPIIKGHKYTEDQAVEMLNLLKNNNIDISSTSVTFPLRAGLAANSKKFIEHLLGAGRTTITLWSAIDDDVDMTKLYDLYDTEKSRIYVDVPFSWETGPNSTQPVNCDLHPDAEEVHNHHAEDVVGPEIHVHDHEVESSAHLATASSTFVGLLFMVLSVSLL